MQTEKWDSLIRAIESDVAPLLKQFGYSTEGPESTEGEGFIIRYQSNEKNYPNIDVDALEQPRLNQLNRVEYETWLRVYVGATFLKTMLSEVSETKPRLRAGWLFSNDDEMRVCIQEIVSGLKQVLSSVSST